MTAPPIVGTESYVSFDQANALAADRLNADEWRAAVAEFEAARANAALDGESAEDQPSIPALCRRALVTATATLDRLTWAGRPTTSTQALAWPRTGLEAPSATIPSAIATACAELAFYLISAEGVGRRPGVQMAMIGQSMETYFPEVADELSKHVRRLVEPFLRVRSAHSAELVL